MNFQMTEHGFSTKFTYGELEVSGDEDYGFRPFQLFAAAVSACVGGVLRLILIKMKLSFEDITIDVDVTRSKSGVSKIVGLHFHFEVKSSDITDQQFKRAISTCKKNCSMLQSINESISITETFTISRE